MSVLELPTLGNQKSVGDFYVIVDFGKGIPDDLQGRVLLHLEMELREAGVPAEVYKPTKADDSKLRLRMTDEERKKL